MKTRISRRFVKEIITTFAIPLFVLGGILLSLVATYILKSRELTILILIPVIISGSLKLIRDTYNSIIHKQFALDYIALLAITVGLLTGNFLVSAVIVLMLSGGTQLEEYGMQRAKRSLTSLTDRIPHMVILAQTNEEIAIEKIEVGQLILVRKGEVIPLDGILVSKSGLTDESSLTGEPYIIDKEKGDILRSGTINMGNSIMIEVTKAEKDSTYRKIIDMVRKAQTEKAPMIRLANKYSTIFTLLTFFLAGLAYYISQDFGRVLAVLVIATPCPLILATPIALMGGMNASAHRRIIVKRLAGIETLSRIDTIIFDKTGTITLGKPIVSDLKIYNDTLTKEEIISYASAIEHNSLHPLAKAINQYAKEEKIASISVANVSEEIGQGISGTIKGTVYKLSKAKTNVGMAIDMFTGTDHIARFSFEDQMKENSKKIVAELYKKGLELHIFTGDKQASADEIAKKLGSYVHIKAECTPEDKKNGIVQLHKKGKVVAMVGDGINDAPALALADVGMVFSNEENTASSEASDIVFLGGDFNTVSEVLLISRRTIQIAKESIFIGIGLSTLGMLFAVAGQVPPVMGAFIQETIDILVIFNALRASVYKHA
ncbi:MAG: heavy metal translocating P-type ATPase [Candidatus Roizmanbacteria bacterium]